MLGSTWRSREDCSPLPPATSHKDDYRPKATFGAVFGDRFGAGSDRCVMRPQRRAEAIRQWLARGYGGVASGGMDGFLYDSTGGSGRVLRDLEGAPKNRRTTPVRPVLVAVPVLCPWLGGGLPCLTCSRLEFGPDPVWLPLGPFSPSGAGWLALNSPRIPPC